jgi:hypothetical protein
MGMDFGTEERVEEIEVFRLDDLVQQDFNVASERSRQNRESWFSLLGYWVSELRWRMSYWKQNRE